MSDKSLLTTTDLNYMTKLRRRGFAVIVWTPEELGGIPPRVIEDQSINHGWDIIHICKGLYPKDEEE